MDCINASPLSTLFFLELLIVVAGIKFTYTLLKNDITTKTISYYLNLKIKQDEYHFYFNGCRKILLECQSIV